MARSVKLDLKEYKEHQVLLVRLVTRDRLEHLARMELLVLLGHLVLEVK
jgi:hypothetical protein